MVDKEKSSTTTTPEIGSESKGGDTKLERLSEALKFAESSLIEVKAALGNAGSIRDVYERDLEDLRERLKKSDTNSVRLRERIAEQESNIVELRRVSDEKDEQIARLEAEAATLRRAKANLDKEARRAGGVQGPHARPAGEAGVPPSKGQ